MASENDRADELIQRAMAAQKNAHAPYSKFQVGAALLCADGSIFAGCNVENASFGLTICAERVAMSSAVAAGQRKFLAIGIVSAGGVTPCGACRQFMHEFAPQLEVILADSLQPESIRRSSLTQLLPDSFQFGA